VRKKILFVFGTRPEAIKLAPLIRQAMSDDRFETTVCSTGQHRDMLNSVFEIFEIKPDYDFNLMRPGQSLVDINVGVLSNLTVAVRAERPDWIVVQGDTTTAMAASMCGFYEKIKVAHVEAGLRTGDIHSPFPEEFNRRVTALLSALHLAPTEQSKQNLLAEGVAPSTVLVTGNTGVDALKFVAQKLQQNPLLSAQFDERFLFLNKSKKMVLCTVHRRESFGTPMRSIMKGLAQFADRPDVELLIPLHPNPEVRLAAQEVFGDRAVWATANSKKGESSIWLVEPQDYFNFVYLMQLAHFIISDSGGIQEEAPALGKPVLVVRENTERPEAVSAGTSRLIGTQQLKIFHEASQLLDRKEAYESMSKAHSPYGDGQASEQILDGIYAASSSSSHFDFAQISTPIATPSGDRNSALGGM
jgi:UDP-N-acetylglucosamine 2-epimerase (non-hydrolysing)